MTAQTAPRPERQVRAQGGYQQMVRYGIVLAAVVHMWLHDRRFQVAVITDAIGTYALGSVTKNNQARPLRRATAWYNVHGQVHDMEVLHRGRRALKQGKP